MTISSILKACSDCENVEGVSCAKAAIFDMDGTLLDSMGMWREVPYLFLRETGTVTPDQKERLWNDFKVVSIHDAAEMFRQKYGCRESAAQIVRRINSIVYENYAHSVPIKEGARELLCALREAKIPVGLATATDRSCVMAALENHGVAGFFDSISTCSEVGASKDASPAVYDAIARDFGLAREDCAVFEDALHAVRTARAAGYKVVAVRDENTLADGEWPAIRSYADSVVNSFRSGAGAAPSSAG